MAQPVRDRDSPVAIAQLSREWGRSPSQVLVWYQRAAELGEENSWGWISDLAEAGSQIPKAIAWAEPMALACNAGACELMESLYLEAGDGENAAAWCLRNKEAGLKAYPHYVLQRIVDTETKRQVEEYGIEPGGQVAEVWDTEKILGLSPDEVPSWGRGVSLRKRPRTDACPMASRRSLSALRRGGLAMAPITVQMVRSISRDPREAPCQRRCVPSRGDHR